MVSCDHGKNSPFYYLKIKWESETKEMTKTRIKCIILRNSTFEVEAVRIIARKRNKAIHCFKTTKLQLNGT